MIEQVGLRRRGTAARAGEGAAEQARRLVEQDHLAARLGTLGAGRKEEAGHDALQCTTVMPSGDDKPVAAPEMIRTLPTVRLGAVPAVWTT